MNEEKMSDTELPFVNPDYTESYPCVCNGKPVELVRLVGEFFRDREGHLYRLGEYNQARKIAHFIPWTFEDPIEEPRSVGSGLLMVPEGFLETVSAKDCVDFINSILTWNRDQ